MEKLKEKGFDLAAIGVFGSNLFTFILILTQGFAPVIVEGCRWLLWFETILDFLFFCWGIERYIKDVIKWKS